VSSIPWWLVAGSQPVWRASRLDARGLDRLVRARVRATLAAAAATDFYRTRLRDAGVRPSDPHLEPNPLGVLAALPPVSKCELRHAGSRALRGSRVDPHWHSSTSSGSTGEPFRVYYDAPAWATLKYLVKLRSRLACGAGPLDRVALLDAIPMGSQRSAVERAGRFLRVSVAQPGAAIAGVLAVFRPDTLCGLPSALLEALAAIDSARLRIPVRRIFTGGELLQPAVRAALSSGFRAPVYDVYGTSETKEVAWECPAGGMHVNADVVHLEVLDDGGQPAGDGVEGELVATLLVNRAMPLVRYRLGDRGSLRRGRCDCGRAFPLLGVVTGRQADTLVLGGGRRISPYALTCAIEQVPGIARYQVTQLAPARLRVRAILTPAAEPGRVTSEVQAVLRTELAQTVETEIEFVDRFPTGARAKFRVVEPLSLNQA
jgi:phenylacetate-CoA ligase